jgi:hypothetical protein
VDLAGRCVTPFLSCRPSRIKLHRIRHPQGPNLPAAASAFSRAVPEQSVSSQGRSRTHHLLRQVFRLRLARAARLQTCAVPSGWVVARGQFSASRVIVPS